MGCKAIREDAGLKRILLDHKSAFEDALARVQAEYLKGRSARQSCPLYPRKRTFSETAHMSAKCQ